MILPFDPEWADAGAVPSDWRPGPLAPRTDVVAALLEAFPEATVDDENVFEGVYRIPEDGTEIWVGDEDPTESVNVRLWSGAAQTTIGRIVAFADLLGTRALDTQTGEFLTAEGGGDSYAEWESYRSRVVDADRESADRSGDIPGH